ncbi:MAG: alpha/beta hydrolase [Planctomycetota bacterium]
MNQLDLPPLPNSEENHWFTQPFSPPGLETVDVLRPAREPYQNPNAPALVLVPGLSMDARGYVRQLQLAPYVDIHTLQANNNAVEGEKDFGHFARHVEEYIIANKLEERPGGFVLGGSSMGGALTVAIALRGRVKPRALVLIGTFANAQHLPYWQRLLAPLSWVLPLDFAKRSARVLGHMIKNPRSAYFRDLQYLGGEHIHRTHGYYGRANMALTRQNQIPLAKSITIPTFIIHGTKDWVLPHAAGEELARTIPGAKFVSVPDAGHILFFTHAEIVNAAIAEFLSEVLGSVPSA